MHQQPSSNQPKLCFCSCLMCFVHLASSGTQEWARQVKERCQGAVAEGAKENGMQPALFSHKIAFKQSEWALCGLTFFNSCLLTQLCALLSTIQPLKHCCQSAYFNHTRDCCLICGFGSKRQKQPCGKRERWTHRGEKSTRKLSHLPTAPWRSSPMQSTNSWRRRGGWRRKLCRR